ncbi:hypothetical protein GCM10007420_18110 [Glycocaulis albus]|uniref:Uncharacterized protein n=1 Tax=Glycocaulis albus TaxID=1382801 RepID=A0ABQ1XT64_9PROT|nr:hypothetical protein GCM10007420_18110 [Glycocaulis albus]
MSEVDWSLSHSLRNRSRVLLNPTALAAQAFCDALAAVATAADAIEKVPRMDEAVLSVRDVRSK